MEEGFKDDFCWVKLVYFVSALHTISSPDHPFDSISYDDVSIH